MNNLPQNSESTQLLTQTITSSIPAAGNAMQSADRCFRCYKMGNLSECSGCRATLYCSEKCQDIDWPHHQEHCTPIYSSYARALRQNVSKMMANPRLARFLGALIANWGSLFNHHIYCTIPVVGGITRCVLSRKKGKPRNCRPEFGCIVVDHHHIAGSGYSLNTIVELSPRFCRSSLKLLAPYISFATLPEQDLLIIISAFNICLCANDSIQII